MIQNKSREPKSNKSNPKMKILHNRVSSSHKTKVKQKQN